MNHCIDKHIILFSGFFIYFLPCEPVNIYNISRKPSTVTNRSYECQVQISAKLKKHNCELSPH